jgi:hypothetical protein
MNRLKTISCVLAISALIVGMIAIPVVQNAIIRSRIYYKIEYNIDLPNREEIIDKVENLNYSLYLINYSDPIQHPYAKVYIDKDYIDDLKSQIENDTKFRTWVDYQHNLHYSFFSVNYSKLNLTYNNETIFSLKDSSNLSLFLSGDTYWDGFEWYLNFTQIPFVYGDNSTLELNETIFVKINLEYVWACGYFCWVEYSYEQYLVLDKNLDIILIHINYYIFED